MLDRLGVQQKLSLLLTLPLAALVVTSVPFVVGRIDDAIAARRTVDAARTARLVGGLVEDLQQERLMAVAALTTPATDQNAFVSLTAASADRAHDVDTAGSPELRRAVADLSALGPVRDAVLKHAATPADVQQAYQGRIAALIDALRLTQQAQTDPVGSQQTNALDALLRTNEQASRLGAALLVTATDRQRGANLVAESRALRADAANRFRQYAGGAQTALLDLVERGPNGARIDQLAAEAGTGNGIRIPATDVAATAQTTTTLGRALQERIINDIAVRAQARANSAELAAGILVAVALALVFVMIWLGVVVSRSVAVPLRRLTTAAGVVADLAHDELFRVADRDVDESRPPKLNAVDIRTSDEIGELAAAFNRVQATAALLMEQQVVNRHNVSIMFANIARRTRALVARQLAFIDEFERNEQDERMLAKLYRLDHLTTRLGRSADSLLVVSGIREDERISGAAPLLEVIRSGIAEIEGYQAVRVGSVCEVMVMPQLVPDLRLLLAELMENATSFSPPGSPVEVGAEIVGRDCRITVADHGIGLSPERLAEENRRLIERERLEVAPTSVLGLFVVGRLARRHGLSIQLVASSGQGVTVEVKVPPTLYTADRARTRPFTPPPPGVLPAPPVIAGQVYDRADTPRVLESGGWTAEQLTIGGRELVSFEEWQADGHHGFDWFDHPPATAPGQQSGAHRSSGPVGIGLPPPVPPANGPVSGPVSRPPLPPPTSAPPFPAPPGASGSRPPTGPGARPQFAPGSRPPAGPGSRPQSGPGSPPGPRPSADSRPRNPDVPPSGLTRGGLKRREPGWHLPSFGLEPPSRADWPTSARDPKAEREELDDFARGVERAYGAADESAGTRDGRPRDGGLPESRPWDGAHAGPVAGGPPYGERVPGGTVFGGTPGGRGTGHPLPGGVPVPGVPIPGGRVPGGPAPDHAIQGNGASPRPADAAGQNGAHTASPEPGPTRRGGLTRRVPGAQLDSSLRDDEPTRHDDVPPTDRPHARNPDAERAALDSFLAGLARAEQAPHDAPANP